MKKILTITTLSLAIFAFTAINADAKQNAANGTAHYEKVAREDQNASARTAQPATTPVAGVEAVAPTRSDVSVQATTTTVETTPTTDSATIKKNKKNFLKKLFMNKKKKAELKALETQPVSTQASAQTN